MKSRNIFFFLLLIIAGGLSARIFSMIQSYDSNMVVQNKTFISGGEKDVELDSEVENGSRPRSNEIFSTNKDIKSLILYEVPFVPQAPSAQWQNIVFQNACEEASMLMAMRWAKGDTLTFAEAEVEIQAFSEFSKINYKFFLDTSAYDTAQIARDFYNYERISAVVDIELADIKNALATGKLVIVPVDGTKLGNPFYTPPGPERHMILIVGYDPQTREFITNDPGTKKGQSFRYDEVNLFDAVRDYSSGHNIPVLDVVKIMITIDKLF